MSYCGICCLCGLAASAMTTYYGPGAAGSGVAELIGYMNGVNYPNFIGVNTLLTKVFGTVAAVAGKLAIGKEGPLAHIGANMAVIISYLPGFSLMRNDRVKRRIVAAGGSAGAASAFGSPIGGALFSYEMSLDGSFWNFKMLWNTFITCSFSVLTLSLIHI